MLDLFDSLEAGNSIRIFKQFAGRGLDLTSYRDLNFWVHADRDNFSSDLEYYFWLAFDENNFYEISFPLTEDYFDPVTGWADVRIKLEDLTGLKFAQSDTLFEVTAKVRDIVRTSTRYNVRLKNRPNMFNIRFLYAGLRNVSQTGQMFAALAGLSQGTFASEISVAEGKATVVREVDGGLQTVSLSLPVVVTTDLRLNEPRYASLPNIMKAKKKQMDTITPESLGVDVSPTFEVLSVEPPAGRQAGIKVESVEELVDKLKNEAKVIP